VIVGGVGAGLTVILKLCVSKSPVASVARTLKLYGPGAVGVPLITPALDNDKPGGSA
jgi:hypothetical protein